MNDVTVLHVPERERYEIQFKGKAIGHMTARSKGGVVSLPHVEIDAAHQGHNYANILVRSALDDIRMRGERIIALCPFVVTFLRRNSEYRDLVA